MITRTVQGTFDATNAVVNIGIGFVPDEVFLYNLEDIDRIWYWKQMHKATATPQPEGISVTDGDTPGLLTRTSGVSPYRGGDRITAASAVYKSWDPTPDKRGEGTGAFIDTWTLGNVGNRTGNWNAVCNTTYVEAGVQIVIEGKVYYLTALSSNGEAANEVTLSEAVSSGRIDFLGGRHSVVNLIAGKSMPAGFTVSSNVVNANAGETIVFIAKHY